MLRKLVMYLSAFLPMFLIMWIKEILLGIRNVLEKPWKYSWKSIYLNPYLIGEIIVIFLIGLILYCLLKHNQRTSVYTITLKTVKNRSAEYYLIRFYFPERKYPTDTISSFLKVRIILTD